MTRRADLHAAGDRALRTLSTAYPGRRYPRSMAEAWPQREAWRGVVTHYRRPLAERVAGWIRAGAVLGLFAFIGVLLALRG